MSRKQFFQKPDFPKKQQTAGNYRNNFQNNNDRDNEKETEEKLEKKEKTILGKCVLCDTNVSDELNSFKTPNSEYIHFECMVKYTKNLAKDRAPRAKNFKVYYIGGGNFAAVLEKEIHGNIQWEILFKVNIMEAIPKK